VAKQALARRRQGEVDDRVQIVENWLRIHGRVEAWQPPSKAGEPGTLTLVVERVDDVASPDGSRHRNLMADAAGTTVQVMVPASAADHYNGHRPHRALALTPPRATRPPVAPATEWGETRV